MDTHHTPGDDGHRVRSHVGDVVLEAWAPTLCGCLGHAVAALVESFAETSDVAATRTVRVSFDRAAPEDLLVSVLREVIDGVGVLGTVPVVAVFEDVEAGGIDGSLEVAPLRDVVLQGAFPRAVELTGVTVEHDGAWRVRVAVAR